MKNIIKRLSVLMMVVITGMLLMGARVVKAEVPNAGLITVDLVIFAGQSNMSGLGGDVAKAPSVANGCGYEFRNGQDPMGLYGVVEPFGDRENGYTSDPTGSRKGTLVSSFMSTYYSTTGIPVVGVSAAKGGTDLAYWLKPEVQAELLKKYNDAVSWCGANNVKIRNKYVVWLQGESDALNGRTSKQYMQDVKNVFAPLFNKGLQQVFFIAPGNIEGAPGLYDDIIAAQVSLAAKDGHFTFASGALHEMPNTHLVDGIHYDQAALNLVGAQAATSAAVYSAFAAK